MPLKILKTNSCSENDHFGRYALEKKGSRDMLMQKLSQIVFFFSVFISQERADGIALNLVTMLTL